VASIDPGYMTAQLVLHQICSSSYHGKQGGNMDTKQILTDLRAELNRIDRAIAVLEGLDGAGTPSVTTHSAQPAPAKARNRRRMSPAGRKRISEMMKARWAARRKKVGSAKKAAPARHMSPATKKRLSVLAKARWAARKKAAKA
jgi:hypothetical protein